MCFISVADVNQGTWNSCQRTHCFWCSHGCWCSPLTEAKALCWDLGHTGCGAWGPSEPCCLLSPTACQLSCCFHAAEAWCWECHRRSVSRFLCCFVCHHGMYFYWRFLAFLASFFEAFFFFFFFQTIAPVWKTGLPDCLQALLLSLFSSFWLSLNFLLLLGGHTAALFPSFFLHPSLGQAWGHPENSSSQNLLSSNNFSPAMQRSFTSCFGRLSHFPHYLPGLWLLHSQFIFSSPSLNLLSCLLP